VSRAESVRKFTIVPSELTEASGHLTPKLSIKRDVIMQDFSQNIEAMYEDTTPTQGISVSG
jgi:long-chain acyl-CoA synthetase